MTATNKVLEAELSGHPVGSLDEVRAAGRDPRKVRCCATAEEGRVAGCVYADKCATLTFGLPQYGGFGPRSTAPGTGGQGIENIAYDHTDKVNGTRVQKSTTCLAFMSGMLDAFLNQRLTGDKVVILGGPGTKYTEVETLTVIGEALDSQGKVVKKAVSKSEYVDKVVKPWRETVKATPLNNDYVNRLDANLAQSTGATPLDIPLTKPVFQQPDDAGDDTVLDMGAAASAAPTGGKGAAGNRRG